MPRDDCHACKDHHEADDQGWRKGFAEKQDTENNAEPCPHVTACRDTQGAKGLDETEIDRHCYGRRENTHSNDSRNCRGCW